MRRISHALTAAAVAILLLPGIASGSSSKSGFPSPGERAQAMGNAFVAVANDTNAVFWNPAGMALIKDRQAQVSHTDLYGLGFDYNYVAYAQTSYGVAWAHIDSGSNLLGSDRGTGGGGDYTEDMYIVAYAKQMDPQTYIGASLKWKQQKYTAPTLLQSISSTYTWLPNASSPSGDGFAVDLGILYKVDESTTVGATIQDLFGEFKTKNALSSSDSDRYEPNISVGFSRKNTNDSLYAVQISSLGKESTVHLGLEKKIQSEFTLRAGLDDEVVTAGVGFTRNEWELNYSFKNKMADGLDQTQRFGAVFHF